jgi:hypothetical protein
MEKTIADLSVGVASSSAQLLRAAELLSVPVSHPSLVAGQIYTSHLSGEAAAKGNWNRKSINWMHRSLYNAFPKIGVGIVVPDENIVELAKRTREGVTIQTSVGPVIFTPDTAVMFDWEGEYLEDEATLQRYIRYFRLFKKEHPSVLVGLNFMPAYQNGQNYLQKLYDSVLREADVLSIGAYLDNKDSCEATIVNAWKSYDLSRKLYPQKRFTYWLTTRAVRDGALLTTDNAKRLIETAPSDLPIIIWVENNSEVDQVFGPLLQPA